MNAANDTLFLRWMHTFAGEEDLETVTALHRLLADQGRPTLRYGAAERYEETTMRVPIHIRYTLKDGRTLCRTFDVLKAQTLEKLLELDQTDCIREERVSLSLIHIYPHRRYRRTELGYHFRQAPLEDFPEEKRGEMKGCLLYTSRCV